MNKKSLCLLFLLLSTIAHPVTGQSHWNIQPEAVDYATIGIKPSEFDSTEPGRNEIIARIKTLMQEEPLTKYYSHAILHPFHVASSGIAGESEAVTVVLTTKGKQLLRKSISLSLATPTDFVLYAELSQPI